MLLGRLAGWVSSGWAPDALFLEECGGESARIKNGISGGLIACTFSQENTACILGHWRRALPIGLLARLSRQRSMMAFGRRPSTDFGTAALHAALLAAFCVLAATGLRIASDDPEAMWLSVFDPVLPMEDLWYRHLVAGMVLTGALAAYALYVVG